MHLRKLLKEGTYEGSYNNGVDVVCPSVSANGLSAQTSARPAAIPSASRQKDCIAQCEHRRIGTPFARTFVVLGFVLGEGLARAAPKLLDDGEIVLACSEPLLERQRAWRNYSGTERPEKAVHLLVVKNDLAPILRPCERKAADVEPKISCKLASRYRADFT